MRKGGDYCWVAQSSTVVRSEDGRAAAEVGTVRDITESKNAEEAFRAASRMEATTTLAGGIAHDFNNLMVGVLGNAELLQARLANSPDVTRMLDTIAHSAQRAGELAQQMLAFARGGKYQPRLMNLNDVVADVLRLEERSIPPRIRIERTLDSALWTVEADPVQLSQVTMNLCINAVEAIEDTGRIAILTRNVVVDEGFARRHRGLKPGAYVCLLVEDTGKGMPAERVAHVFEPFYSTKAQGRGLGLAAAYGIVKNHEGYIAVSSEIGAGTTFTVYLPAVGVDPADVQKYAPQRTEDRTPARARESTVLVVDDEPVVLDVTRQILENLGYRALCANNGREAVDIAESFDGDIHAVVLDMGMPVMGGAQAFPLLMKARPNLKVLISSGYELDPAAQAMLDAGAQAFIQKPFRAHVLAAHVRQALAGTSE
jgi:signal transduction histidine kinase/ActR/RegA family two-component response regulator